MSERSFTIRPYRPGDEEAILELFNGVFGEGEAGFEPRTLEQWRWMYSDNPAGTLIMLAVEESGRVIAHYAFLPARTRMDGEIVVSGLGVDSMVHRDYRRGLRKEGAFVQTTRAYFSTIGTWPSCAMSYGFPNRKALPVGVRVIGYKPVFEPVMTLYRNFFQDPDDDAVGRDHADEAEVVEIDRIGPELDLLWTRHERHFPLARVRDATWLRWRYDRCPFHSYRKFLIRPRAGAAGAAAAPRAFFVTRPGWQKQPIQALLDYVGAPDDAASVALALRTTTRLARESGQARVEAWWPERSPFFRHALAAGMRSEPSLYVLCVVLSREKPDLDWVREHWYYTIGDSDAW